MRSLGLVVARKPFDLIGWNEPKSMYTDRQGMFSLLGRRSSFEAGQETRARRARGGVGALVFYLTI